MRGCVVLKYKKHRERQTSDMSNEEEDWFDSNLITTLLRGVMFVEYDKQ